VSDKDKIMEMPEGKSSEEIDAIMMEGEEGEEEFKADQNLAQEALEATEAESPAEKSVEDEKAEEETPEAKEEVVVEESSEKLSEEQQQLRAKDSKIASMKHQTRDLELENAKLQGELQARKELQTQTVTESPKSPLELAEAAYIKEFGELPEEGLPMSSDLYRKQKAFDDEQAAKTASTDNQQRVSNAGIQAESELQTGELSAEQMGQGLDLQTVAGIGTQYLTKGDRVDIADIVQARGSKAGLKEAYNIMVRRTLAAGNEDSKLLQNAIAIKAKGKTVTQKKTLKTEKDVDELTTEGEAESEEINPRLAGFAGIYKHITT
jgi:hypothetical protein